MAIWQWIKYNVVKTDLVTFRLERGYSHWEKWTVQLQYPVVVPLSTELYSVTI